MANGLGTLFNALAGGETTRRQAYTQTLNRGASAEYKLARAREERAQELQRQQLAESPMANTAIGQIMLAGYNPSQYTGARADQQNIGMQRQNYTAAQNPDVPMSVLNRMISATAGKQYMPYDESGGVVYRQDVAPTVEAPMATPVGRSKIAENMGLSGSVKPPNFTAPSNAALLAVLGGKPQKFADPSINPQQYQSFLRWQANKAQTDPHYADGDFALSQYANYLQQHQPPAPPPPPAKLDAIGHQGVNLPFGASVGDQPLPYTPKSQAEFDALPAGAYFVDPQSGKLFVK